MPHPSERGPFERGIELVTAHGNATLKRLRALREKKYRIREGLFLAEGVRICIEALDSGWTPEILLLAEGHASHPLVHRLVQATLGSGGRVLETSTDILGRLSGKDNPQTVVAAFPRRAPALADFTPGARTLVAERLRDPGNLGTLLRACDAAGANALILLDECTDPSSIEAVRASMGACFTVAAIAATTAEFLGWARAHGGNLVGAALTPRATDYRHADYGAPALLLVGNEAQGLPPALCDACDQLVQMPMLGRADSLNVAMAGTLLLYEALRAQAPPATGKPDAIVQ